MSNDGYFKDDNFLPEIPAFPLRRTYEPFYDERRDYNTNAKSFYDYLARYNAYIKHLDDFINRLLRRNIYFDDTASIDFNKKGDWIDNGGCKPPYDDNVNIKADLKISKASETKKTDLFGDVNVPNGTKVKNDGAWSPDYYNILDLIQKEIKTLTGVDQSIFKRIENIEKGLQKIVDNLYKSGAITNNNIANFEFKNNRDIATGNINLFGGTPDGNSFIKTSDGKKENDITAGY